ncbi:MAG: YbhB/YbcL family Raf kinase inhibitor-like protein [Acidimicrobiia bacterium]|nr:YbhB/YbcL family Raf kinase inhibitor-like protein [Acidimicrobiia bacterium]
MPDLNLGELTISCPSLGSDAAIPERHAAGGENVPPTLEWSNVPEGTAELVLIAHDPDAPLTDGFTHWVVHGIDPATSGLEEGKPRGGGEPVTGPNEVGETAYMGPAPPGGHGRHHYFFHLYALDEPLDRSKPRSRDELLEKMDGHIIEQARVVGYYEQ